MCHVNIDHVFFWQSVYNVLSFLYKWKTMTCSLLCRLAEWFCFTWDSWLFELSRYCTKKTSHCLITTTVRNPICSKHSNIRIVVVFPCSMALATTMTSPTLKLPESSTNWQDQRRLAFCESPLTMVCIHTDHWHDITDTLTKWHKIVSNEVLIYQDNVYGKSCNIKHK